MKEALALFFTLSLYLLPNPTHSTRNPIRLPTAASGGIPVVDMEGDELQPGKPYMLRSWNWTHGGVRLASLDGATTICPSDVILGCKLDYGSTVTFTPADPNAAVVLRSSFLNIQFAVPTVRLCANNVSWEVEYEASSGQRFVKAGDVLSHPFKIESIAPGLRAYMITYCESGTDNCYEVGSHYGQQTRLALSTDEVYAVTFMKPRDV
ncbi:sporamin B-like [Ipomoea triloba]|uniref:sporamin B-like n=1 Tax=Ipomoea triloba TaxID=35885 RepID=UPI00125DB904|nr:sporamin B-like [Ipomoea triloba]